MSILTKDNLLGLAYELLWHEHQITSVEVGEAPLTGEDYHSGSCDVCDLLKDINKELEFKCKVCDDCAVCNKDCCSDCGVDEDGEPFCNCEDHSCSTIRD